MRLTRKQQQEILITMLDEARYKQNLPITDVVREVGRVRDDCVSAAHQGLTITPALPSLNEDETRVHHAIIDLYELEDEPEVMTSQICNYTGMLLYTVTAAMRSLVAKGVIAVEDGVVTQAENLDYFPIGDEES